jgi:hypothetical protein
MSLPSANDPMPLARTTIVYRPVGGIEGYREVRDKTTSITVLCFPYAAGREVPKPARPGCYIFASDVAAYIGETNDFDRRFGQHARDPSKSFAREVYVVTGAGNEGGLRFNSTAARYFQYHLNNLGEQSALVEIIKGVNPSLPEVDEDERATLDIFLQQSLAMLFDAGCRVFRSNFASQLRTAAADVDTAGPAGTMEIGVVATPPIGGELALAYGDLWARGYHNARGFVVLAGSEVRADVNPSAWDWIDEERNRLTTAGALLPIPGLTDRKRPCVAVQFDSPSSAAKVVTGSRDACKWVTPRPAQPMLTVAA